MFVPGSSLLSSDEASKLSPQNRKEEVISAGIKDGDEGAKNNRWVKASAYLR